MLGTQCGLAVLIAICISCSSFIHTATRRGFRLGSGCSSIHNVKHQSSRFAVPSGDILSQAPAAFHANLNSFVIAVYGDQQATIQSYEREVNMSLSLLNLTSNPFASNLRSR